MRAGRWSAPGGPETATRTANGERTSPRWQVRPGAAAESVAVAEPSADGASVGGNPLVFADAERVRGLLRMRTAMDLRAMLRRTTGVRKMLVVLVMVAVAALAGGAAADRDHGAKRVSVPGRLSIRVPAEWHLVHGWLSDVTDPAPRLAIASFPARLSPHTCECGFPNVVDFPHNGAFVFVWEYLHYPRRRLARVPRRPVRFSLAVGKGVRLTCDGPNDGFSFKDAGRVFQVEVYLGPDAGPALRTRTAEALDSLRVAANA
jgi:hypothetical protein